MDLKKQLVLHKIWVELIWLVAALLSGYCFMIPMRMYGIEFPFTFLNLYFIGLAITFIRWLFLWKYTPYAWHIPGKLLIIGLVFSLLVYGFDGFQQFKGYLQDTGLQQLVEHLSLDDQDRLTTYMRSEMIFWAIAFLVTGILLLPKIFWSIWKQINRQEV